MTLLTTRSVVAILTLYTETYGLFAQPDYMADNILSGYITRIYRKFLLLVSRMCLFRTRRLQARVHTILNNCIDFVYRVSNFWNSIQNFNSLAHCVYIKFYIDYILRIRIINAYMNRKIIDLIYKIQNLSVIHYIHN